MKIIKFSAANIKRLVAIEITPDGNMVEIVGRNGAGKTSVLDAIWWAICGAGVVQDDPIRHGQERAFVRLDLGELIVQRTFTRTDGDPPYTTRLTVTTGDGRRFAAAQTTVLDTMLNAISFDPLMFANAKGGEQYDMLRTFVPAVDFVSIDRAHEKDFEARREVNAAARQARAVAAEIAAKVPDDLPADAPDEKAIAEELTNAAKATAALDRRRRARGRRQDTLALATAAVAALDADEKAARGAHATEFDKILRTIASEIQRLEGELAALQGDRRALVDGYPATLATLQEQQAEHRKSLEAEVTTLSDAIEADGVIPDDPDVTEISKRLSDARAISEGIRTRTEHRAMVARAETLEAEAQVLTDGMDKRQLEKEEQIAAAGMPVQGIGLGNGIVTLDGVPFSQASDAQRLRTSIAIAMAANPKLRVIRVRDGSLLDSEGMRLLAAMAEEKDCQVWIERVGDDPDHGFIIEDGALRLKVDRADMPETGAA